jgi:hypothetical protein
VRKWLWLPLAVFVILVAAGGCDRDTGSKSLTSVQSVYDEVRNAGVEVGTLQIVPKPLAMTQEEGQTTRPDGTEIHFYIPTPSWDRQALLSLFDLQGGSRTLFALPGAVLWPGFLLPRLACCPIGARYHNPGVRRDAIVLHAPVIALVAAFLRNLMAALSHNHLGSRLRLWLALRHGPALRWLPRHSA